MKRLLGVPLLVASVASCGGRGVNTDCQWPTENSRPLDLQQSSDARHLQRDIELAEELSIRYGDVRWPPGSARRNGRDDQCLTPLLGEIARRHSVPLDAVSEAREQLGPVGANLVVNGPVGMSYAIVAWLAIRQIYRRFSFRDELFALVVASAGAAVLVAGVTVGVGRLWEAGIEIARIGNGHLSYRGLRLQWTRFPFAFFVSGIALFCSVSLAYYWWIIRGSDTPIARSGHAI
jgi:hypothetical protein